MLSRISLILLYESSRAFLELDAHVADGLESTARIFAKTFLNQSLRRARWQHIPVGLFVQNLDDRVGDGLPEKCDLSGERFVETTPERPNIRTLVDGLTARLLRAHVRGRSQDGAGRGGVTGDGG